METTRRLTNRALAEAFFELAEQEEPGDRRVALLKAGYAVFDTTAIQATTSPFTVRVCEMSFWWHVLQSLIVPTWPCSMSDWMLSLRSLVG